LLDVIRKKQNNEQPTHKTAHLQTNTQPKFAKEQLPC